MTSFPLQGETYALLSAVCWAIATVLFTVPSRQIRAEAVNLFKTTLAAGLLILTLVFLRGRGAFHVTDYTEMLYLGIAGFLGISIADTLYFYCLKEIGAWRTLVLGCLAPPCTALLSALMMKDPMESADIFGMIVALAGVLITILSGRRMGKDGLSFKRGGTVAGVVMSVLISLGIVLTKMGTAKTGALEASTVRIVIAVLGILLIDAARRTLGVTLRATLRPPGAKRLIWATLIGTYVAYLLFIGGIKHTHPGVAIALGATAPAFVIPLAAIFLKERINSLSIAGTVIAVAGIVILFLL